VDIEILTVIGLLIIFFAALLQGITSFGFALLAMPLLSMFLSLHQVVPIIILFSILTNIGILYHMRLHVELRRIWILICSSIIAAPIGTYLLIIINPNELKIFIGVLIALLSIALLKGMKATIRNERLSLIPVGFMSGLLNGSVSMSGPPIVLFLSNQGVDKQVFRANLAAYSLILNIVTLIPFFLTGLISKEVMHYSVLYLPALIVGLGLGIFCATKVKEAVFKKYTLYIILASGLWTVLSSLSFA
jgi:uncharacterized membrane protein YfcA